MLTHSMLTQLLEGGVMGEEEEEGRRKEKRVGERGRKERGKG